MEKTNMDPENHWFVEENSLSRSHSFPGFMLVFGIILTEKKVAWSLEQLMYTHP